MIEEFPSGTPEFEKKKEKTPTGVPRPEKQLAIKIVELVGERLKTVRSLSAEAITEDSSSAGADKKGTFELGDGRRVNLFRYYYEIYDEAGMRPNPKNLLALIEIKEDLISETKTETYSIFRDKSAEYGLRVGPRETGEKVGPEEWAQRMVELLKSRDAQRKMGLHKVTHQELQNLYDLLSSIPKGQQPK